MKTELQILKHYGLMPGDSLTVPKSSWQIVQHHALYLGDDVYGQHWMCENAVGHGVKLTRVGDFFLGVTKVISIKKFSGRNTARRQAVEKALSRLGKPYNLINYNCEHFVNDVLYNQVKSQQLEAFKTVGTVFLVLLVVGLIVEV